MCYEHICIICIVWGLQGMVLGLLLLKLTRCTQGVRVVFSRARMRSSNSARMNKSNFTT